MQLVASQELTVTLPLESQDGPQFDIRLHISFYAARPNFLLMLMSNTYAPGIKENSIIHPFDISIDATTFPGLTTVGQLITTPFRGMFLHPGAIITKTNESYITNHSNLYVEVGSSISDPTKFTINLHSYLSTQLQNNSYGVFVLPEYEILIPVEYN